MRLSDYRYLPKEEYDILYWRMRENNERSLLGRLSLATRRRLHPAFLLAYKIMNRINGLKVQVTGAKVPAGEALIFAATHVGKYDVEAIGEAIKSHFYLLSGDFENLHGGVEQIFLNLNGVFYFKEDDVADRRKIIDTLTSHLQKGGSILYYPEGAWNLSPNIPVHPLFPGVIRIAKKTGVRIIPIGAEQYDKQFEIIIGEPFTVNESPERFQTEKLRDTLASLKWQIWEEHFWNRDELSENYWEKYIDSRLAEWPGFNRQHIAKLVYHPKGIAEPSEAFAFMRDLIPSRENAFLFNKRLSGLPF